MSLFDIWIDIWLLGWSRWPKDRVLAAKRLQKANSNRNVLAALIVARSDKSAMVREAVDHVLPYDWAKSPLIASLLPKLLRKATAASVDCLPGFLDTLAQVQTDWRSANARSALPLLMNRLLDSRYLCSEPQLIAVMNSVHDSFLVKEALIPQLFARLAAATIFNLPPTLRILQGLRGTDWRSAAALAAEQRLSEALFNKDHEISEQQVIQALQRIGGRQAGNALAQYAALPNRKYRHSAAVALGNLGDPRAVVCLLKLNQCLSTEDIKLLNRLESDWHKLPEARALALGMLKLNQCLSTDDIKLLNRLEPNWPKLPEARALAQGIASIILHGPNDRFEVAAATLINGNLLQHVEIAVLTKLLEKKDETWREYVSDNASEWYDPPVSQVRMPMECIEYHRSFQFTRDAATAELKKRGSLEIIHRARSWIE